MNAKSFTLLATSFIDAAEKGHFKKIAFSVNQKIFATLDLEQEKVSLKLAPVDQSVFNAFNGQYIYPATGVWGKQGWTIFEINHLKDEMINDALTLSYCNVAPKKLAEKYKV